MQEPAATSSVPPMILRALSDEDVLVSGISLGTDTRRALHAAMRRMRAFDETCVAMQRAGKLDSYLSAVKEEAVICGASLALTDRDWIFPTPREHGVALSRGVAPSDLAAQIFGRAADPAKGRQAPCHVSFRAAHIASVSGVTGAHLPHAVGLAWAARSKKDDAVVLAFLGDGATSSGDFHNALNFAAVMKAPVLFMCRNNGVAMSTPVARQTASESLAEKAHAYGMPGLVCDGSDAIAVYTAVRAWASGARAGAGPMLIEAVTSQEKDPIARLERHLLRDGLISEADVRALAEAAKLEASRAISEAIAMPSPAKTSLFEDVFASVPAHLASQSASQREP